MKKKEEIKQLDKLLKSMKRLLKAYLKDGQQENLHQFRIQVKKLKAMLTLYSCEPENKSLLKDFKPIKEVFKKAGVIRNAHINLKLGEKHQLKDENFNQHQQRTLDENTLQFNQDRSRYLKKIKKTQIILQNTITRLHNKTIRTFYKNRLAKIKSFFENPTFDDQLHNARKNIKLLLYNKQLAAKAIENKVQINQVYLDQLQDLIGEWHDHNLTIAMLANHTKTNNPATNQIKKSNATLEKKILALSNNFEEKVKTLEVVQNATEPNKN